MNSIRNSSYRRSRSVDINMAPLIDMVFLLLIFFLVTTSFVKEVGVDVQRPSARTAAVKEKADLMVAVTSDGSIHMEGKRVDVRSIRPRMQQCVAETPDASVVIVADRESRTGVVIEVLDECRLAGVPHISVAARKKE